MEPTGINRGYAYIRYYNVKVTIANMYLIKVNNLKKHTFFDRQFDKSMAPINILIKIIYMHDNLTSNMTGVCVMFQDAKEAIKQLNNYEMQPNRQGNVAILLSTGWPIILALF